MIEAWGREFEKIKEACAKYDGRLPEYSISASGIMVLCEAGVYNQKKESMEVSHDYP